MAITASAAVIDEFTLHDKRLRQASEERRKTYEFINVATQRDSTKDLSTRVVLGQPHSTDRFQGDVNLRTLRALLATVDERGWDRSDHQRAFHSAFERCVARVLFRQEWAAQRPAIMRHHKWERCNSEVLISTPRRFGKTFSIAIFCACLALTQGVEIVVFSPARRASRKLLERIVEFVRVLDCEHMIMEFNMEALRVKSYGGKPSLVRSFPSKVGVRKPLKHAGCSLGGTGHKL